MKTKKKRHQKEGFWSSLFHALIYQPCCFAIEVVLFVPRVLFHLFKHFLSDN